MVSVQVIVNEEPIQGDLQVNDENLLNEEVIVQEVKDKDKQVEPNSKAIIAKAQKMIAKELQSEKENSNGEKGEGLKQNNITVSVHHGENSQVNEAVSEGDMEDDQSAMTPGQLFGDGLASASQSLQGLWTIVGGGSWGKRKEKPSSDEDSDSIRIETGSFVNSLLSSGASTQRRQEGQDPSNKKPKNEAMDENMEEEEDESAL